MDEQQPGEVLGAPIEWNVPDDVPTHYVTNVIVQRAEHEVILNFFELWPPFFLGTEEEKRAQAMAIKSVRAECVARIVVATERMPAFAQVIQQVADGVRQEDEGGAAT